VGATDVVKIQALQSELQRTLKQLQGLNNQLWTIMHKHPFSWIFER